MVVTLWAMGDSKLHGFLQLSSWGMVVVEGTLVDHEFLLLPKDGCTLFHYSVVSQEMFEILYFMEGNPLHHNFEYGIVLLHSHPVYYEHVYTYVSGPCLNCSFFYLFMYPFIGLSHHWVMGISLPAVPVVTPSRMDFTASTFSFDVTWLRASTTALSLPF